MMMLIVGICLMTLASVVAAQDPASSWLTYAHTTTGKPIQSFYAELIVPSYPRVSGGSPAFWIGIEDRKNLNLIQPVRLAQPRCLKRTRLTALLRRSCPSTSLVRIARLPSTLIGTRVPTSR